MIKLRRVKKQQKHKRYKPRNVNLNPKRLEGGTFIYAGDSLHTVPCPNKIIKWMRQNLRRAARRSQIVFPLRRIAARNIMDEMKIPDGRK